LSIKLCKVEKSTNEELKQVTYIAMLPDEVDLHGDFTSADEVRKACENFNKSAQRANLFHMVMTDTFEVIESYLSPTDFVLDDKFVKKGTWLMTLQVKDDTLWNMIKSGDVNGISIGAMVIVENLEEESNE
jgi:L-arabinose isomerase